MFLADNVISHHLQNVFWILGTPCGGKSTIARLLAEKCGAIVYSADEKFAQHKKIANPVEQPALCRKFKDWDSYFEQPINEYSLWLKAVQDDLISMIIVDLLKLSEKRRVIFEGFFDIETIERIAGYQKIVFLGATEDVIRDSYFDREDKKDMHRLIGSLSDPKGKYKKVLDLVVSDSERDIKKAKEIGLKVIIRDKDSSIIDTLEKVQSHFGLRDVKDPLEM